MEVWIMLLVAGINQCQGSARGIKVKYGPSYDEPVFYSDTSIHSDALIQDVARIIAVTPACLPSQAEHKLSGIHRAAGVYLIVALISGMDL